jgi:carboxyl-terminal processing protease
VVRKDENGNNQKVEISLTRSEVKLEDQAAKITYEQRSVGNKTVTIGVLDFPSFYGDQKRSSFEDIKKILVEAKAKKIDGLIVNLSRNGGGLLEDAYKIGGLFIKKGPIVATRNSNNDVSILADEDDSIFYNGPLVLLTSRASASASEILSGALKDYRRALVVGSDHTFGKGTVQTVIPLNAEIGALKVTTGMFFIPGGQSTQHQGVAGDVLVPSLLNNDKVGEKVLDHSLPPKTIAEFLGKNANTQNPEERWVPISTTEVKSLMTRSKLRVDQSAKFKELKKDIAEAKKSDGVVKIFELDAKVKEDKKKNKDDDKKSLAQRVREADAPIIGEALNVMSDLIAMRSSQPLMPALATKETSTEPKN